MPEEPPTADSQPTLAGGPTPQAWKSASAPTRIGPYEIRGEISRGGMGVVYRAHRPDLGRDVALKLMIAGEHASPDLLARFLREARSAARLDHPNVVHVFEAGQAGPCHYIAMQLLDGMPLSKWSAERKPSTRDALEVIRKVALALEHAHAQGILHRDVKPGNILIDATGEPHLTDFGLAKDLSAEGLTAPGAVLGTPSYVAPEQAEGALDRIDARTDVFSLGATLYCLLTGGPPFTGSTTFEVIRKAIYEDPVPPRQAAPDTPPEAEAICLKAMEKNPSRRYQSAREMADDIARFLSGEALQARPVSTVVRTWRRLGRRRPVVAAAIAILLVVTAAIGGLAIRAHDRADDARRGVAAAARLEAAGQLAGARDLLRGVLLVSPDEAQAKTSLARIEAALAREEAARVARGQAAAGEASSAEEVMRKAELVSSVFSRWARLDSVLRTLEAIHFDSRLTAAVREERARPTWAQVQAFLDGVPSDPTSQAAARALGGWARRLAGHAEEGEAEIRAAAELDPDVPTGLLMQALVLFSTYAGSRELPLIYQLPGRMEFGPLPPETPERAAMRKEIEALLERARKARVWGKEAAADFAGALDAARATDVGEYDRAEEALSRALDAPDLRAFEGELRLARIQVR